MSKRSELASPILAAAIAAVVPAHAQTLYKCVAGGKTSYQAEPCAPHARQSEIAAPRPAPAPAAKGESDAVPANSADAKAPGSSSGDEIELVIDTFVGYTVCSEADPGFGARHAYGFDGWKERHTGLLQRFNRDPEGAQRLQQRLQAERARQAGDPGTARAARIEMCARIAGRVKPLKPQP